MIERRAHLFGRSAEILFRPEELDVRVADRPHGGERSFGVGLHGVAYGIELEADAVELGRAGAARGEE